MHRKTRPTAIYLKRMYLKCRSGVGQHIRAEPTKHTSMYTRGGFHFEPSLASEAKDSLLVTLTEWSACIRSFRTTVVVLLPLSHPRFARVMDIPSLRSGVSPPSAVYVHALRACVCMFTSLTNLKWLRVVISLPLGGFLYEK